MIYQKEWALKPARGFNSRLVEVGGVKAGVGKGFMSLGAGAAGAAMAGTATVT